MMVSSRSPDSPEGFPVAKMTGLGDGDSIPDIRSQLTTYLCVGREFGGPSTVYQILLSKKKSCLKRHEIFNWWQELLAQTVGTYSNH